jgi:hypothetical protein
MGIRGQSALVGLALVLVGGCQKANAPWQKISSPEGRFTALFRGTPSRQTESAPTPIGSLEFYHYSIETSDGAHSVAYCDFPASLVQNGNLSRMLDGAREGALSKVQGQLLKETKISLNGCRGREFLIKIKEDAFCRAQIFLARNRMYVVQFLGNRQRVDSKDAEKFFDAFDFDLGSRVATRK